MTFDILVRSALAVAWASTPLASAAAGELGLTSRASLSITVTIPPHVGIRPHPQFFGDRANGLCVAANGLREFRVAILDSHGMRSGVYVRSGISNKCEGTAVTFVGPFADKVALHAMTLLIIPD